MNKSLFYLLSLTLLLASCRSDDIVYPAEVNPVTPPQASEVVGFYLLNEGNMGSNKCTLDYFDYSDGIYTRNVYGEANPDVPKELGDVGNDLKIYGSRLYAVINCSNKVEVMNVANTRRIGQIDIPNCRYIAFHGAYAYVTSYAGPVKIDPDYTQLGYVAKVDTATLEVVDKVIVGYQPDGLAVSNGRIYVANSGGYRVPNYENTLSVIDIDSFREIEKVEIDINLSRVTADNQGRIWVASRGDYFSKSSKLFCYDPQQKKVVATLDTPVSSFWLDDDRLYIVATSWSYETMSTKTSTCIVNTATLSIEKEGFITDGTDAKIKVPYTVAVSPDTKDIYVSDARTYVNPGYLYCFSSDGILKWQVRTGDIPSSIAFVR
ncbi:MAG: YncE family protein [Bacteroidales bacterium]|nr:YncE family protein [Bacteroidales bacterium]